LRLWLPALTFGILLFAGAISTGPPRGGWWRWVFVLVWFTALAFAGRSVRDEMPTPINPFVRPGYRPAAAPLAARLKKEGFGSVATIVRPPLIFYLAGEPGFNLPLRRINDPAPLESLPQGSALLVDRALTDNPALAAALGRLRAAGRVEELARFPIEPSAVTRLDDGETGFEPDLSAYDVILYRIR
jgi:hypothetical protein